MKVAETWKEINLFTKSSSLSLSLSLNQSSSISPSDSVYLLQSFPTFKVLFRMLPI